jgi:hypothetical protein
MTYEQVKGFYPKDMGTQKGWCLKNCRVGFHIYSGKYASAKVAMQAGKKNGTYHAGTPPTNISVPVYCDTASIYEHVVVSDHGVWYSDGKKVVTPNNIFGWDEMMDGVRVVHKATDNFLPAKGYWCRYDKDDRIASLAKFMYDNFPAYTSKKALGPLYGDYLWKAIKEFQRRTGLYPDGCTGPITYKKLKEYGF